MKLPTIMDYINTEEMHDIEEIENYFYERSKKFYSVKHEILTSNNQRVWINAIMGECIARFDKRFGIDIHNTLNRQENTGIQCLFCLHGKMEYKDWLKFISEIYKYYRISIDENLLTF